MKIDSLILGAYQTNCYILRNSETAEDCLIIDTGLEAGELIDFLNEHKLNPVAVVLTHGHPDHITGVAPLRQNFCQIEVYIHKLDAKMLTAADNNMLVLTPSSSKNESADLLLEEGAVIERAGIKLQVLHTPGHTPGGICLYSKQEAIVFSGDTLFAESIGRIDLGGGSMRQLIKSIKEKLLTLPDQTVVCPGHGPATTIAREKEYNPFLQ